MPRCESQREGTKISDCYSSVARKIRSLREQCVIICVVERSEVVCISWVIESYIRLGTPTRVTLLCSKADDD